MRFSSSLLVLVTIGFSAPAVARRPISSVVPSPTPTATPTPTPSVVPSPTPIATPTPSVVPSPTPTATPTPIPSVVPSPTPSGLPQPRPTPNVPVCGNGRVEAGEYCDDGNTRSGDGCDSMCRKECTACFCGFIEAEECKAARTPAACNIALHAGNKRCNWDARDGKCKSNSQMNCHDWVQVNSGCKPDRTIISATDTPENFPHLMECSQHYLQTYNNNNLCTKMVERVSVCGRDVRRGNRDLGCAANITSEAAALAYLQALGNQLSAAEEVAHVVKRTELSRSCEIIIEYTYAIRYKTGRPPELCSKVVGGNCSPLQSKLVCLDDKSGETRTANCCATPQSMVIPNAPSSGSWSLTGCNTRCQWQSQCPREIAHNAAYYCNVDYTTSPQQQVCCHTIDGLGWYRSGSACYYDMLSTTGVQRTCPAATTEARTRMTPLLLAQDDKCRRMGKRRVRETCQAIVRTRNTQYACGVEYRCKTGCE